MCGPRASRDRRDVEYVNPVSFSMVHSYGVKNSYFPTIAKPAAARTEVFGSSARDCSTFAGTLLLAAALRAQSSSVSDITCCHWALPHHGVLLQRSARCPPRTSQRRADSATD